MIDRTTRLRWRRRVRRRKRQVEDIGFQAEEHLERHLFKRLSKLPGILRFSVTWIALMLLLIGGVVIQTRSLSNYYLVNKPVSGGIYTEGILGSFSNANPLYATNSVDSSVARLVFAGLFKFNTNNRLVGELASGWKVDAGEQNYTVKLRDNLFWHDGQPLTADDVVFTYRAIQNPDTKSPLYSSWQDITVKAKDAHTIVFSLPNPLGSFPYAMTNGIIPKHLLNEVPYAQLRSVNFNTSAPVGSGPFKWGGVTVSGQTPETREEQITLNPFGGYALGKPKLNKFIIRSFRSENRLLDSFRDNKLSGVAGLTSFPADLQKDIDINEYSIPLQSEVMVFFKTSIPTLSDTKVRQALASATDTAQIIKNLGYAVTVANEPLLKFHLGYNKKLHQLGYNLKKAEGLLKAAGWKNGPDGIKTKRGKRLSLNLYSQDDVDYRRVAALLKDQWRRVGVDLTVNLYSATDLQSRMTNHNYDILLYGIELGVDSDVFPYWDSTQADIRSPNRLNFSEYKSSSADAALEAGRTRLNPKLRTIKYKPFLEAWRNDAPAVALYQPRFLYVTHGQIFGFDPKTISSGIDRYANVANWMIREDKLPI